MALWGGRFSSKTNDLLAILSESISYDQRLYAHDIAGSIAHVRMLGEVGVIEATEVETLVAGLENVLAEYNAGEWSPTDDHEDIHMAIEARLTEKVGAVGGKLARKRATSRFKSALLL